MGFDEWLARCVAAEPRQMHLRLYSWSEGSITAGYNQRLESTINWHQLGQVPVIRRVTGGRAIYHDPSEITYSLVWDAVSCPSLRLWSPGSSGYEHIALGLVAFLRAIGIPAEIVRRSSSRNSRPDFFHKAPCFSSRARWEILSGGEKIVASAARRFGTVVLQHGAIKLHGKAAHPALDSDVTSAQSLRRVEPAEFEELAIAFEREVSYSLGLTTEPAMKWRESLETSCELQECVDYVQKNRLEQRDIFERRERGRSL